MSGGLAPRPRLHAPRAGPGPLRQEIPSKQGDLPPCLDDISCLGERPERRTLGAATPAHVATNRRDGQPATSVGVPASYSVTSPVSPRRCARPPTTTMYTTNTPSASAPMPILTGHGHG